MNLGNLIATLVIGLIFGAWPIIGKSLRVDGGWMVVVVMAVTTLTVAFFSGLESTTPPSRKVMIALIFMGVLNGLAMISYGQKTTDHASAASAIVVGVSITMIVGAPFVDLVFNRVGVNRSDLIALALALAAIYVRSGPR